MPGIPDPLRTADPWASGVLGKSPGSERSPFFAENVLNPATRSASFQASWGQAAEARWRELAAA
eukprot:9872134-Lingulodinium_polyedra.AAC.1